MSSAATSPLTAERSASKVAAVFANRGLAQTVATELRQALQLAEAQVQVVVPDDAAADRKLQPESANVARTLVRTHIVWSIAGLIGGLVVFAILWAMGVAMIVQSAITSAIVLAVFGIVAGLLFGGLLALRPDQDAYILTVKDAIGEGRSAVVVHAASEEQKEQAKALLEERSGEVVASL